MKNLLATTAIVMIAAASAHAQQSDSSPAGRFLDPQQQTGPILFASDIIGAKLFSGTESMGDSGVLTADMESGLESVGEVDDILLAGEGDVQALVLNVGGFLGIGQREVVISMDEVRIMRPEGDPTEVRFVINATREEFEAAPAFDRTAMIGSGTMSESGVAEQPQNEAGEAQAIDGAEPQMQEQDTQAAEGGDPSTDQTMEEDPVQLAESLQGATVFNAAGDELGNVVQVEMADAGDRIETLIIDVGAYTGTEGQLVEASFGDVSIEDGDTPSSMRVVLATPVEDLPMAEQT